MKQNRSILHAPRPPIVQDALAFMRDYAKGKVIDGSPATRHPVVVVQTLEGYGVNLDGDMTAATILHDAPYHLPPEVVVSTLTTKFGSLVTDRVMAIKHEHDMMDSSPEDPQLIGEVKELVVSDPELLVIGSADKIVAFRSILARGNRSENPAEFWGARRVLRAAMPFFVQYDAIVTPLLPPEMSTELSNLVSQANANFSTLDM